GTYSSNNKLLLKLLPLIDDDSVELVYLALHYAFSLPIRYAVEVIPNLATKISVYDHQFAVFLIEYVIEVIEPTFAKEYNLAGERNITEILKHLGNAVGRFNSELYVKYHNLVMNLNQPFFRVLALLAAQSDKYEQNTQEIWENIMNMFSVVEKQNYKSVSHIATDSSIIEYLSLTTEEIVKLIELHNDLDKKWEWG
ncbi:MAG: hypothetical protein ACFE0Q_12310, partial [Anaerolineae bacterium]